MVWGWRVERGGRGGAGGIRGRAGEGGGRFNVYEASGSEWISGRREEREREGVLGGIVEDLAEGVLLCELLLCRTSDGLD